MTVKTTTWGQLPTFEEFSAAWDRLDDAGELRGGVYRLGNDPRLGDCELSKFSLWDEIEKAMIEFYAGPSEEAGDWVSVVLGTLGFEWI